LGYCNEIKVYLKSFELEILHLTNSVAKFNQKHEDALAASNRGRSNEFTDRLNQSDQHRDESFAAFRNMLKVNLRSREKYIVSSAYKVCEIIRTHGWTLYFLGKKL